MSYYIRLVPLLAVLCLAIGCGTDNTPVLPENASTEPPSFSVEASGGSDGQQEANQLKPR